MSWATSGSWNIKCTWKRRHQGLLFTSYVLLTLYLVQLFLFFDMMLFYFFSENFRLNNLKPLFIIWIRWGTQINLNNILLTRLRMAGVPKLLNGSKINSWNNLFWSLSLNCLKIFGWLWKPWRSWLLLFEFEFLLINLLFWSRSHELRFIKWRLTIGPIRKQLFDGPDTLHVSYFILF